MSMLGNAPVQKLTKFHWSGIDSIGSFPQKAKIF